MATRDNPDSDFSEQERQKIEANLAEITKSSEKNLTLRSIAIKVMDAFDGMAKSVGWIDGSIRSLQERSNEFNIF
jgi:uncharacterized protein (DUF2235 family)